MKLGDIQLILYGDPDDFSLRSIINPIDFFDAFDKAILPTVCGSVNINTTSYKQAASLAIFTPIWYEHQLSAIGPAWGKIALLLLEKAIIHFKENASFLPIPEDIAQREPLLALNVDFFSGGKLAATVNPTLYEPIKIEPAVIWILFNGLGWAASQMPYTYQVVMALRLEYGLKKWTKDYPKVGRINWINWNDVRFDSPDVEPEAKATPRLLRPLPSPSPIAATQLPPPLPPSRPHEIDNSGTYARAFWSIAAVLFIIFLIAVRANRSPGVSGIATSRPYYVSTTSPTPTSLFPSPTPTPARSFPNACVTTDTLNVRKGPGTAYEIVDGLKRGECVVLMDYTPGTEWTLSSRGWVYVKYIEISP